MSKFKHILREADIHDERQLLNTKWNDPAEIRRWLIDNGFKRLGGGVFSTAYAKPGSKRVVKISLRSDTCWLKFAKWAISTNQVRNPYVPQISFIQSYNGVRKGRPTKFFLTIIERLDPIDVKTSYNGYLKQHIIDQINDPIVLIGLLHHADVNFDQLHERLYELGVGKTKRGPVEDYAAFYFGDQIERAAEKLLTKNKNHRFLRTLAQIEKMTESGDCGNDLHAGNFMWRSSTKTIVITDPLAGIWT